MSTALPDAIGTRRLSQGITATWWYTATGVLAIQAIVVFMWVTVFANLGHGTDAVVVIVLGGLAWLASSVVLLVQYRHRDDTAGPVAGWRGTLLPIAIAIVFGVLSGVISGMWVFGALPIAQSLMLLNWPRGVRLRLVIVSMMILAALWFIDGRDALGHQDIEVIRSWWLFGVLAVGMPSMTVVSLWWWDVLVTLDRARAAEARLGATQERLRVATDVHDLQGHHLQVIALQLELTERLFTKDPDAALEQLRLARASVIEARQGTRDLAMRFRGVPLPDEIANAVDLLRAAGTSAEASLSSDADQAPASVLGPVIRETTTNVLRHGGGRWARLSLVRQDGTWRYEIVNDAASDSSPEGDGSGLDGVTRRVAEAGGEVRIERARGDFHVIATVPDAADGAHVVPGGNR